ncbi:MAG: hypothetical protein ACOY94_13030 [Bacillota bacterium]
MNTLRNLIPSASGSQCFVGTVVITPTGTIGATTGLLAVQNTAIPVRQVPGPSLQGVSLDQLNQRQAVVCGNFIQDTTGLTFNVTFAFPLPGGTGTGTGLGTGLGASL